MKRSPSCVLLVLAALVVTACAPAGSAGGEPPADRPGADASCAVCGMSVASHPEWIARVVFEDGSSAFFDGCKDLFKYLLSRDRYLPEKRNLGIKAVYVTDYYDMKPIEARTAFFVEGSDVLGPMGRELVPLASLAAAREFQRDHGGARIIRYEEVTRELLRTLD